MICENVCVIYFPTPPRDLIGFAEACLQLSPQIAIRQNEAVFIETAGLKKIFSTHGFLLRIQALLRRFQTQARIVICNNTRLGLAFARFGSPHTGLPTLHGATVISKKLNANTESFAQGLLPIEAICDYYDPFFRHEPLEPRFNEFCLLARKLGITSLGQLKSLPTSEVNSRFGSFSAELLLSLHAKTAEVWPYLRIPDRLLESQELPEMPFYSLDMTLQPLLFTVRSLLDRLFARLRGRGQKASQLVLRISTERFSTVKKPHRELLITLPLPQSSTHSLFPILHEKLQHELTHSPLESSPQKLEIEILQTTQGSASQVDFLCKKEEISETLSSLLVRLKIRLGEDSVFYPLSAPDHLPEKSWTKSFTPSDRLLPSGVSAGSSREPSDRSSNDLSTKNLPQARRPTRLLPNPLELIFRDQQFLTPGSGNSWKVTKVDGPEKMNLQWWDQPIVRDYYNVLTQQGEALWIYFDQDQKRFFLHGFYD